MTAPSRHRRAILQGLLALPCLAAGARAGHAAPAAGGPLAVQALGEALWLITGAGGNVVVCRGAQESAIVDSGAAPAAAPLLALLEDLTGGIGPGLLINTHWHDDHTGGNEALRERGARIFAHENTRLWLGADFDVEWRGTTHQPRPAAALPDRTTYTSGHLDAAGTTIEYLHYPQAHTDGDLAVYFPAHRVLVAGGLLSHRRYPVPDIATGGWIGGLLAANAALLAAVDDTVRIVPDRGPALSRTELKAQHAMLADLYEKMKELAREGYSGHDMLQAGVTAAYDAQWGDPREFVLETYRGMWAHTYDMGGFI